MDWVKAKIKQPVKVLFLGEEIELKKLTVEEVMELGEPPKDEKLIDTLIVTARACFPKNDLTDSELKTAFHQDGIKAECAQELLKIRFGGTVDFLE